MKIQDQDTFHGPALMQIVEHDSFKALNKADDKYGHYLVNKDIRLWVKYASASNGPWQFTFQPNDLALISKDLKQKGTTHIVLVCGHFSICSLSSGELEELLDVSANSAQWLKVEAPANRQMRVTGSDNSKSPILAPHNKFPGCVFQS